MSRALSRRERASSWDVALLSVPIFFHPFPRGETEEQGDINGEYESTSANSDVPNPVTESADSIELFQPEKTPNEDTEPPSGIQNVDSCDMPGSVASSASGREEIIIIDNDSMCGGEILCEETIPTQESNIQSGISVIGPGSSNMLRNESEGISHVVMSEGDDDEIVLFDPSAAAGSNEKTEKDSDMSGSIVELDDASVPSYTHDKHSRISDVSGVSFTGYGEVIYTESKQEKADITEFKNGHPSPISSSRRLRVPHVTERGKAAASSINTSIRSIDDTIHKVFERVPVCRTYLHWRNLLVRIWTENSNGSGPTASVGDLEELTIGLKEAESKWVEILHKLKTGEDGKTFRRKGYLQVSLDDDTHPEKRDLANLERMLYSNLNAWSKDIFEDDGVINQPEDDEAGLFWWRYFGVKKKEVPRKQFCQALSMYLRHEFNLFIGSEENLEQLVQHTVDIGSDRMTEGSNDEKISTDEFCEFISRYGPLKSCLNKMRGVCIVDSKGRIKPANWFYPYNRMETERLLKFGKHGRGSREWVARLGWRQKNMAFVFSYLKRGSIKCVHTPVTHFYKQETEDHTYEMETMLFKMRGRSMRELILNICSSSEDEKSGPIFENMSEERKQAMEEQLAWNTHLTTLRRKQQSLSSQAIAEGFMEVYQLHNFFGGFNTESRESGLLSCLLETQEGESLFKWIQGASHDIHKNIQFLTNPASDAKTRKKALRFLQRLAMAAASGCALSEDTKIKLESFNTLTEHKLRVNERKGKHYLWALNDYRRDGQTIMHELVNTATDMISKKNIIFKGHEKNQQESFRPVLLLIRSLSMIGVPLNIPNGNGMTPVEYVVVWFANHRSSKGKKQMSGTDIELFHDLFITIYERTSADFNSHGLGERTEILKKVLRGIIPQGDIRIIEYLVKNDSHLRHILRHEPRKERNVFLSLSSANNQEELPAADGREMSIGKTTSSDENLEEHEESFLHYLINQTCDKLIDTHFDAYGNAPRIAKLVFSELQASIQGIYCSLSGGPYGDTPILAAARANHKPMILFLLHISTRLRRDFIQKQNQRCARGGGAIHRNLFTPLSTSTPRISPLIPENLGSTLTFQLSLENKEFIGTPICNMADRDGNCLLHFLAESASVSFREVSMVLSALDSAGESTNSMVDRMNANNETPLSKVLLRYRELKGSKNQAQLIELSNVTLLLLARGARTAGLRQDEMEILAEVSGAAMQRCSNYRWSIMRNAVLYGDDRLVDLILTSKAIRTFPFLKHPRFIHRKSRLKKRRDELALQQKGLSNKSWAANKSILNDTKGSIPSTARQTFFQGLSEHTLLHVATSSPHSSAKIVERLFRQDQFIADRKFRGQGKELVITPDDLENQLRSSNKNGDTVSQVSLPRFNATTVNQAQIQESNLLRLGLNQADSLEKNPLHYIASKQNTQTRNIAKLLVENSVDILHMDAEGMTPLHVAARANQLEIVDLMVNTHMHLDIKTGRSSISNPLVPQTNKRERTALFFAVEQGNWQICSLLLARKASVDEFDSQGKTALTVGFQWRYARIADIKLCRDAIIELKKWKEHIKRSGKVTLKIRKKILAVCRECIRIKDRQGREYQVFDPLDPIKCIIEEIYETVKHTVNATETIAESTHIPVENTVLPSLSEVSEVGSSTPKAKLKSRISSHPNAIGKEDFKYFLTNDQQEENLIMQVLDAGCVAFENEIGRLEPLKNNLKVTIDVLLNHGADIETAFRLIAMDVSNCINVEEEFQAIEQKFEDIQQEVDDSYTLLFDEPKVTADEDNNDKKSRENLFEKLKQRQEKQRAISERRDVVFKTKFNQIVINQRYHASIYSARCGELWWYILFLGLITFVGVHSSSRDNKASFFFSETTRATLLDDDISETLTSINRNFMEIDSLDEFYQWSRGPFLDVFYPTERFQYWNSGELLEREPTYLGHGRVVGLVRWRQQRWDRVDCNLNPDYQALGGFGSVCTSTIDVWPWIPVFSYQGSKETFGLNWVFENAPGVLSYTWAAATGRWYPGGGFVQDFPPVTNFTMIDGLPSSRSTASNLIDYLQNVTWIDAFTKVVFIEYNIYNANEDLWLIARMNLEFPNTGGVLPSSRFHVLAEISYPFKNVSIGLWVIKSICLLMAIWHFVHWSVDFCFVNQRAPIGEKLNIESFYAFVEIFINLLYALVVFAQIVLIFKTREIQFSNQDSYVDMSEIAFVGEGYTNFFSILLFLLWVKFTDLLSVKREISRLVVMIMVLLRELLYLLFFMLIMWIAFACGIFVAYGYRNQGNTLWITSALTAVSNSFNGQDLINDRDKAPFMGTLYGILALIFVILVLMNLVIAVLTTAYENARKEVGDAYWARHQYRLVQQYKMTMEQKRMRGFSLFHIKASKLRCNECSYKGMQQLILGSYATFTWFCVRCTITQRHGLSENSENSSQVEDIQRSFRKKNQHAAEYGIKDIDLDHVDKYRTTIVQRSSEYNEVEMTSLRKTQTPKK